MKVQKRCNTQKPSTHFHLCNDSFDLQTTQKHSRHDCWSGTSGVTQEFPEATRKKKHSYKSCRCLLWLPSPLPFDLSHKNRKINTTFSKGRKNQQQHLARRFLSYFAVKEERAKKNEDQMRVTLEIKLNFRLSNFVGGLGVRQLTTKHPIFKYERNKIHAFRVNFHSLRAQWKPEILDFSSDFVQRKITLVFLSPPPVTVWTTFSCSLHKNSSDIYSAKLIEIASFVGRTMFPSLSEWRRENPVTHLDGTSIQTTLINTLHLEHSTQETKLTQHQISRYVNSLYLHTYCL